MVTLACGVVFVADAPLLLIGVDEVQLVVVLRMPKNKADEHTVQAQTRFSHTTSFQGQGDTKTSIPCYGNRTGQRGSTSFFGTGLYTTHVEPYYLCRYLGGYWPLTYSKKGSGFDHQ